MKNKTELYNKEQNEIINNIIDILDLDEQNSCVLYELDNNNEKQCHLMKLVPQIRKFFSFSRIIGVSEPQKAKRPWLGLIKQITKYNYNIISQSIKMRKNGQLIRTQKYIFIKKF